MTWNSQTSVRLLAASLFSAFVLLSAPGAGAAQDRPTQQLSPAPEGMIGLGLIGAELGMFVPAIAGVSDTWPYLVFPAVGAIGGGIAGVFLLQDGSFAPAGGAGHPEIAVAAFAVGLAALIPALVVTASATTYDPEDDVEMSKAASDAGPGLVRVSEAGVFVAPPGVAITTDRVGPPLLQNVRREVAVSVVSGRF